MSVSRRFGRLAAGVAIVAGLAGGFSSSDASAATGTGAISGVAFRDADRDGFRDAGEASISGQTIYLFDGARTSLLAMAATDASGRYTFNGLGDADYLVELASADWEAIKLSEVPTTTGSLQPRKAVRLSGTAAADFGWRTIVRSSDANAPISTVTASSGLRIFSYNDAVSASTIASALDQSTLVGAEATKTTVRFDLDSSSFAMTSIGGSQGSYVNYSADVYVTYRTWLEEGDRSLDHEYGHAASLYYAYMVQQDSTLSSYLNARGIAGDPRLGAGHDWNPREILAEDFRQLFGSPNAKQFQQENTELPSAEQVPGLRSFLETTFRQAPGGAGSGSGGSGSGTTPAAASLAISQLSVNPQSVTRTGTISFTLSKAARVTVQVVDSKGVVVRTLLSQAETTSGSTSTVWDRKNTAGQRVKSGSYLARVIATDSATSTTLQVGFSVA